ncbi:right-handed parallel beta-helix repeat-containing protein [Pseudolysobacter antarcticus]|uniref:Right-handed parallel beta-helix repeat-containing protein n=1 Tax=Pseudolysobacter antarcticus TaxID=2511995 RepID=A0A411HLU1_9GAMM|nr:right-handed parallel beta-helix repeat-containing protein [Pseudolysobacter antarcticus]QBB71458.1 right-handed parallel beta-helix repeat-containing protein [Pseudolysobacter antarcticus]
MISKRKVVATLLFGAASLLMPFIAIATSPCVNTVTQLQANLATWGGMSSGDMTIRIVQGNYPITLSGFSQTSGTATLSLLGGYTANCASRLVNPTNTVIDGQNSSGVRIYIATRNDVTIEGISFTGLHKAFGLYFDDFSNGSDHTFTVRYNIFHDFQADGSDPNVYAGVHIRGAPDSGGVNLHFQNNLVYGVSATSGLPAIQLTSRDDGILNMDSNTIAGIGSGTAAAVNFYSPGSGAAILENNIIYNGTATSLSFSAGDVGPIAGYNLLGNTQSSVDKGTNVIAGDISNNYGNPLFANTSLHDYHLANNALLSINSGGQIPGLTGVADGLPAHDLDGKTRVVGSAVDRGAYENQTTDDLNNFTVTTIADNGNNTSPTVGSLRWAIKNANANTGASKISFSVPCLSLFNLSSPLLPNITTNVSIDGYSNPGAIKNTSDTSFNANLCVVMNGGASAAYALHTSGSGRLTVRGLAFVGFTDAAIRLEGGGGNYIQGDQFGGIGFTNANHDGIRITGASGNALIGGYDDPSVMNLISGCSDVGVYIDNASGANTVATNLIGLGTDGTSAISNSTGLFIANSPKNIVQYNTIDNSASYGVEIRGVTVVSDNTLQYNTIAANAAGGVLLDGADAMNNTIGAAFNGGAGGNTISANGGPGVWVSTGSGIGNRILVNSIYGNAGLAIDLGGIGAMSNDVLDGDAGANNLQNYPVLLNAFRTPNQYEVVQGVLDSFNSNGVGFRIDFYLSSNCSNFGTPARGETAIYIGGTTVDTNASGHIGYWVKLPLGNYSLGYLSATATAPDGSTSEIGECKQESQDLIFRSSLEGGGF